MLLFFNCVLTQGTSICILLGEGRLDWMWFLHINTQIRRNQAKETSIYQETVYAGESGYVRSVDI